MLPKVSLILTTYNCRDQLDQTLCSIQKQDYENLEVIIKDGGSEDGTLDIIQNYLVQGMSIIWKSQRDQGIYDAMNQGYSLSSGEIIAFFNDQFTQNNAVSLLVNAIREGGDDCIGAHADLIYTDGDRIIRSWHMGKGRISHGWMPGHPTLYLKRVIFEQYGIFDTRYKIAADYEFMIRFLYSNEERLAYVSKILVKMYYAGTSTNGLGSYLLSLHEGYQALVKNGVRHARWVSIWRTIRVLKQFIK